MYVVFCIACQSIQRDLLPPANRLTQNQPLRRPRYITPMEARAQALQRELQSSAEKYRTLQLDVQKNHRARQQFLQQQYENEVVLKELVVLEDDANVYKLIGPVLVKQDPVEAKSNVEKRLEFIGGELKRLDGQLQGMEEQQQKTQQLVMKLQQEMQRMQQAVSAS